MSSTTADISHCIRQLAGCDCLSSAVFRKQVILRLRDILERLRRLAEGQLIFESTETWRTVYEDVLQSCQTRRYLSVALIRSDDYWRDAPGENSLEFNFALLAHGFYVHRVFIIDEFFWPRTARTPSTQLFRWIQNQHQRGVDVSLVRLTELEDESSLVCDMGIYGSDAVGWQQTDLQGRTLRYEVSFNRECREQKRNNGGISCSYSQSHSTKSYLQTEVVEIGGSGCGTERQLKAKSDPRLRIDSVLARTKANQHRPASKADAASPFG